MMEFDGIGTPPTLTARRLVELAAPDEMPDDGIDCSDIPETLDWSNARRRRTLRGQRASARCSAHGASLVGRATPEPAPWLSSTRWTGAFGTTTIGIYPVASSGFTTASKRFGVLDRQRRCPRRRAYRWPATSSGQMQESAIPIHVGAAAHSLE